MFYIIVFFVIAFAWGDTDKLWPSQPVQWSVGGLVLAPPLCPADVEPLDEMDGDTPSHNPHTVIRDKKRRYFIPTL